MTVTVTLGQLAERLGATLFHAEGAELARRGDVSSFEVVMQHYGLANDPALNFHMDLAPGDVQLVHNHTLLHDRTAFEDWLEPERRRHLLRLWLSPDDARPLPPAFTQRFGSITAGERGGIIVEGTRLNVPFEAV